MITVAAENTDSLDEGEVAALYDSVGWTAYTTDLASLVRALAGSHRVVTARKEGRLAGLARSV
ncbi:hypothetical protein [Saccharomonospora xinjiangensis]|uniref:hypothetical protein n=1 Tax=Saccharomonospora xinjiangensis TaxID=75294 RepID=UPI001ADB4E05|nr:hypothetical protein [Saccharomonospora xinjiangensis]